MQQGHQQQTITWAKWEEISQLISTNPNKAHTPCVDTLSGSGSKLIITPPGPPANWEEYMIQPAGHLSALLYCLDPFFTDAPDRLRTQLLIDAATNIPQELDEKIRTLPIARHRKKALEWLGTSPGKLGQLESRQLWDVLMTVFNYQSIIIDNDAATNVRFAPADVRTWVADKPLVIINEGMTHIWTSLKWNPTDLLMWLNDRASVEWPIAEGTKTELLSTWETYPTYNPEDRKKRKEELAILVGKVQALKHITGMCNPTT
jgi:hypothetical protein